jgi:hypothetical protein
MTRGQIVFEVSRALGLDDTASSDELTLMQRWVNRGIVDILMKTRCYMDLGSMTLQAGVTDYRIDTNILVVNQITVPDLLGNPQELDVINMNDILPYLSNVVVDPTAPRYAAVEGTFMRVAPAPTSATVLTYLYVPKPTEIPADGTTGSDSLDPSTATYGGIPTEYHDAIVDFVLWQAAAYDDKGGGFFRGHAFAPGSAYQQVYQARIDEIKKEHRRKAGRGMHAGKIGYPTSGRFPRRNDTYSSTER